MECESVDAPTSIECMNAVWLDEGCEENGTHYPATLVGANRDALDEHSVQ